MNLSLTVIQCLKKKLTIWCGRSSLTCKPPTLVSAAAKTGSAWDLIIDADWKPNISKKMQTEAPMRAEFLQKRLISAFFGFQWLNLAEILHLFKKYNNVGKVAVKRVSLTDYAL